MRRLVWLAVGLSLAGAPAHAAECAEPRPPAPAARPKKSQPPPLPICTGVNNCTRIDQEIYDAKVDAYETAAAAFKGKADAYVAGLKAYAEAALGYARCEAQRLDEG